MNNNVKMGVYTHNDKEVSFNFYTSLSACDKVKFVNSVTDTLVGDNYNSVIRDIIFDFYVIDIFTDVDTSDVLESDNAINEIEALLNETNIVAIVKKNADSGVIEELVKGVDLNIEYRTGIHSNPIAESLSGLLDTIERKVSNFDLDGMMKMAQSLSGVSGELTADKILEAYSKTDMFKDRYKQMVEDGGFKVDEGDKKTVTTPILSPTFEV